MKDAIHPYVAWSLMIGQLREKYLQMVVPQLVTKQGVVLSIQGSEAHYCMPKITGQLDYASYEVMIICEGDFVLPEFMVVHNADGPDEKPRLFGYVPESKVIALVDHFGGLCWQRSTAKLTEYVGQIMKKGRRS